MDFTMNFWNQTNLPSGIRLFGNWKEGWALDIHTIRSVPLPDGGYDTERTEIGEMLYQLKYRYDRSKAEPLAEITSNFLKKQKFINQLKAIIPVPPSDLSRPFQPVTLIAQKIGKRLNLPVITDYLIKVKETSSLKNIDDSTTRKEELKDAFKVKDKRRYAGKSLLVFDDIYRSGETLTEITRVLYEEGKVKEVYVLVLTKTRTKR